MQFFTLLALSAMALPSLASLPLPPNLPDGAYVSNGTINPATGFAHFTHIPFDPTVVTDATSEVSSRDAPGWKSSRISARADTPRCQGAINAPNMGIAQDNFANFIGGQVLNSGGSAWWIFQESRSYACSYRNGNVGNGNDFRTYVGVFDAVCGQFVRAFYAGPGQLNYGRGLVTDSIC